MTSTVDRTPNIPALEENTPGYNRIPALEETLQLRDIPALEETHHKRPKSVEQAGGNVGTTSHSQSLRAISYIGFAIHQHRSLNLCVVLVVKHWICLVSSMYHQWIMITCRLWVVSDGARYMWQTSIESYGIWSTCICVLNLSLSSEQIGYVSYEI